MATKTFRVNGAAELDRVLKLLPKQIGAKVLQGAVMAGAKPIQEEAQRLAPRATGKLAANIIRARPRRERGRARRVGAVLIGPSTRAFYGLFLEFGTSTIPAQPFLRPAFDAKAGEALARIGAELGKRIERAAVRLAGPLAKSGLVRRRRRRR